MGKGQFRRAGGARRRSVQALPFVAAKRLTLTTGRSSSTPTFYPLLPGQEGSSSPEGGPYKKDDNAHVEQKNWTHVRKLLGYLRYDTSRSRRRAQRAVRRGAPLAESVSAVGETRSRASGSARAMRRRYDAPQTPLQRLLAEREGRRRPRSRALRPAARNGSTRSPWRRGSTGSSSGSIVLANRRVRPATVVRAAGTRPARSKPPRWRSRGGASASSRPRRLSVQRTRPQVPARRYSVTRLMARRFSVG